MEGAEDRGGLGHGPVLFPAHRAATHQVGTNRSRVAGGAPSLGPDLQRRLVLLSIVSPRTCGKRYRLEIEAAPVLEPFDRVSRTLEPSLSDALPGHGESKVGNGKELPNVPERGCIGGEEKKRFNRLQNAWKACFLGPSNVVGLVPVRVRSSHDLLADPWAQYSFSCFNCCSAGFIASTSAFNGLDSEDNAIMCLQELRLYTDGTVPTNRIRSSSLSKGYQAPQVFRSSLRWMVSRACFSQQIDGLLHPKMPSLIIVWDTP